MPARVSGVFRLRRAIPRGALPGLALLLPALAILGLPVPPAAARDRLPDPAALAALALIPHPAPGLAHAAPLLDPVLGLGAAHGLLAAPADLLVFDGAGSVVALGSVSIGHGHPFGIRRGIRVFRPAAHIPLVLAGGAAVVPGVPGRYEERAVGEGRYQIRTPGGGVAYRVREREPSSPGYGAEPVPVGRVVVDVEPADAEVWLNGRKLSPASPGHFEWSLVEGRYPLEVRAPGHGDFRREVRVEPGRSTELRVVLEPGRAADHGR